MATNIFISFRYSDGNRYKKELEELFKNSDKVIDYSEDVDRKNLSDITIQNYLYDKLKRCGVIIVILTPKAINYNYANGKYDDWLYDELRYGLEDRDGNRTKGVIAIYTQDAKPMIIEDTYHKCDKCNELKKSIKVKEIDNLVYKNQFNILSKYKKNKCDDLYDTLFDCYIPLISYEDFKDNFDYYIDVAVKNKNRSNEFDVKKRMD